MHSRAFKGYSVVTDDGRHIGNYVQTLVTLGACPTTVKITEHHANELL